MPKVKQKKFFTWGHWVVFLHQKTNKELKSILMYMISFHDAKKIVKDWNKKK